MKLKTLPHLFFFCIVFGISITSCNQDSVVAKNLPDKNELNQLISESIQIPFHTGDTVLFEITQGICGLSTKEEEERYYPLELNTKNHLKTMRENNSAVILVFNDSLQQKINERLQIPQDSINVSGKYLEKYYSNKLFFRIGAVAETEKIVKVTESYTHGEFGKQREIYSIVKLFEYEEKEWKLSSVKKRIWKNVNWTDQN